MATSPSYYGNFSDREQPTLGTVAKLIADARTLLQDVIPEYRYDDASLVRALNETLLDARRLRADLFVFNIKVDGQTQAFTAVDDTYVDMEPQFRFGVVAGICAHALMRDQEDVQDIRAGAFLNMFNSVFIGRAMTPPAGGSGPGRQQAAGQ
jgi:hypothetical protein